MSNKQKKEQEEITRTNARSRWEAILLVTEADYIVPCVKMCVAHPLDVEFGRWSHAIRGGEENLNPNLRYFQVVMRPVLDRNTQDLRGWRVACMDNGDNTLEKSFLFPNVDTSDEKRREVFEKALACYNAINDRTMRNKTLMDRRGFVHL